MNKAFLLAAMAFGSVAAAMAQGQPVGKGGLTPQMMTEIRKGFTNSGSDRALRNAIAGTDINKLATNADVINGRDTHFSHKVESKGITDQKSSGRCWLFTGLNMLRAQMMAKNDLPELILSQNYNFFWDQLEKSNLFLQAIIDTADKPMSDQTVDFLFKNPVGDGGTFTGVADNVMKYGVVPAEIMHETNSSDNTSTMRRLLGLKLREFGLELRGMKAAGKKAKDMEARKTAMLTDVYRILALNLGEPPTEFTWTRKDKNGKPLETKTYTPQQFYAEFAGNDLQRDYVMLMNDPSRPYNKVYEIDLDRHSYDGHNWRYVNLPIEDIKEMAIASIKDSTMMYFSCDVGKLYDSKNGICDLDNFNYDDLLGVTFGMDKAQRIQTFASGSTHAMTLMAVDLDDQGKPRKWMVENSWGPGANGGHLILTDPWFNEYMFRLVVNDKYVTPKVRELLKQKPILLPAWDPMF